MNLGHETQAWYDRHMEIHEVMGVQVNSEMPKMWTPFRNSGDGKSRWKHQEKIFPKGIHTQD
jgi:hypothetical protein